MTAKIKKILWVALFCALFLYATYFQLYTHDYTGYRERWLQCLDYLKDGTFWSGQPYCDGGPFVYYAAYIIRIRSGIAYFQNMILIINTLLSALVLYFTYKVYNKETGRTNKLLLVLLYGFLAYVNAVTEFETMLMVFFIFLAYYILFYTKYKQKEWYAGIFIAAAMISKFSAIILFGIIGICYLFKERIVFIENKKIMFAREARKYLNGIKILLPTGIIYTLFRIKYEYFFVYLFLTQTKQSVLLSYGEVFRALSVPSFNASVINIIPLYFIILICAYELFREIKEKSIKSYTVIAVIGFPILIFLMVKSFGIGFATDFRYWVPIQPFVILSIMRLFDALTKNNVNCDDINKTKILQKAIFTAVIGAIIVFPGAYYSPITHLYSPANFIVKLHPFTQEKFTFMSKLNYGYSIVPEQQGKVLVEWGQPHYIDELYQEFNISIPRESIFSITNTMAPTHPDVWQFPRFKELLGNKLIYDLKAEEGLTKKEKELVTEIQNGTYSLIIFGPPNWFVTNRIWAALNESGVLKEYCAVNVPSNVWGNREGLQIALFFFKNPEDCNMLIKNLSTYYTQNYGFEEICKIDTYYSNIVRDAMKKNRAPIEKKCVYGGEGILPYLKENTIIKQWQLWCMLLLMLACFLYFLPAMLRNDLIESVEKHHEKKRQHIILWGIQEESKQKEFMHLLNEQKRNKIIYYIILISLFLLLLYLYAHLDYAIPYNPTYVI